MADLSDIPEEIDELAKQIPDGIDMDEFVANVTRLASEFMQNQSQKPIEIQVIIFFVFLLIPLSLMLYCFCKILNSQKKRQGKDKKKQKEPKRDIKKRA